MLASGLGMCLITLPLCGVESWLAWLEVARQTELYYQALPRWTALSRDLPGLIRRVEQGPMVEFMGWALVASVVAVTAWAWRRGHQQLAPWSGGCSRAALLAGVILSCPRFMFYDMTLAVVPVLLGFAGWADMGRVARWCWAGLTASLWLGTGYEYLKWAMVGAPLDTFGLLALWIRAIATSRLEGRSIAAGSVESPGWSGSAGRLTPV
jgi:hypothetical protein